MKLPLKWFVSVPVIDETSKDCIAVLSCAFEYSAFEACQDDAIDNFYDVLHGNREDTLGRRASLICQVAESLAAPLRALFLRNSQFRLLENAASSEGPIDLARHLVKEGAYLIGQRAYLSLLLPDDTAQSLRCVAIGGPNEVDAEDVWVSIDASATAEQKGISGWVYLEGMPWPTSSVPGENSRLEADGCDGRPMFKDCILDPAIVNNYCVPIKQNGLIVGVLNAEAPGGVLTKDKLHLMSKLADWCSPAITRHNDALSGQKELAALRKICDEYGNDERSTKTILEHIWSLRRSTAFQFKIGAAVTFLLVILLAVLSMLGEISDRREFGRVVEAAKVSSRNEMASLVSNGTDVTSVSRQLLTIEMVSLRLRNLEAAGASSDSETLHSLIKQFDDGVVGADIEQVKQNSLQPQIGWSAFGIRTYSSKNLLAIVVTLCGAIGAIVTQLVAQLRTNALTVSFRWIALGTFIGFFAFGAMEAIKYFIVFSSGSSDVTFNPCTSVLAGLIAGAFTERSYFALRGVVGVVVKRAEERFGVPGNGEDSNPGN